MGAGRGRPGPAAAARGLDPGGPARAPALPRRHRGCAQRALDHRRGDDLGDRAGLLQHHGGAPAGQQPVLPRLLQTFLQDRVTQHTLGVFVASFVYALTLLRSLAQGSGNPVPQLAVTLAFGFVLGAVAMFLAFIHHITSAVGVGEVLHRAATDTRRLIERGQSAAQGLPQVSPSSLRSRARRWPWPAPAATWTRSTSAGCAAARPSTTPGSAPAPAGDLRARGLAAGHGAPGPGPVGRGPVRPRLRQPGPAPGALDGPGRLLRLPPPRRHRRPGALPRRQRPHHGRPGDRPAAPPAAPDGRRARPLPRAPRRRRGGPGGHARPGLRRLPRPGHRRDRALGRGQPPGAASPGADARGPHRRGRPRPVRGPARQAHGPRPA